VATKDSETSETENEQARAGSDEDTNGENETEASEEEESTDDAGDESSSDDEEASDEEASGDEGSGDGDESSSDDDASSSDEEAEAKGEASGEAPARKTSKAKGGKTSAGARLAAAKAAKAARKAAKRGKDKKAQDPLAQVRASAVAQQAQKAASWAQENRGLVIGLLVAVALGLGGYFGWTAYKESQAQAAAGLLETALEISRARIRDADDPEPDEDDDERTYTSERRRAEAALRAFRRVISAHGDSEAAVWARLGEARALFDLGRYDQARRAYEQAYEAAAGDSSVSWRALEGRAFTYEAEQEWDRANAVYRELAQLDERRFEPVAKYHMARIQLEKGERQPATTALRDLVRRLREADDDEEIQDFPYVLAQAELRLRELDPTTAPPQVERQEGGNPLDFLQQLPPEQREEFIRRFMQQQQQQQQLPPMPPGGGE
jgi:predicted negative regulator of RcsB-dependent stress response